MPINENGVYIPPTIDEIKSDLQQELIDSGVDLNVFDNSNYIQTTNPIVTAIINLANNQASFPTQVQNLFNLQNIQIKRAGINTQSAILDLLLADPDITKADVRNFSAGEVTIYVYSDTIDLNTKDFQPLTDEIVPKTSVFGLFVADTNTTSITASAERPNSLETTTVIYNIAEEVVLEDATTNYLQVSYSSTIPIDQNIEKQIIEDALANYFLDYNIGQELDFQFIACIIYEVGKGRYKNVTVTANGIIGGIAVYQIPIYVSSEITYVP